MQPPCSHGPAHKSNHLRGRLAFVSGFLIAVLGGGANDEPIVFIKLTNIQYASCSTNFLLQICGNRVNASMEPHAFPSCNASMGPHAFPPTRRPADQVA